MLLLNKLFNVIAVVQIIVISTCSFSPSKGKQTAQKPTQQFQIHSPTISIHNLRKVRFVSLLAPFLTFSCTLQTQPHFAHAFDNAIPNSYKMPKSNGPAPTNLGLNKKTGLLRSCSKPSLNCFSTTSDNLAMVTEYEDEDTEDLDESMIDIHLIPKWKYKGVDPTEAYKLIDEVLESYEPGQANIDGGGFKIIKKDEKSRYFYIQYESLKRGYIDDVEIVVNDDNTIQVGSSSRLGYLDYAVNAKRLNYIATQLQDKSNKKFDISFITQSTHPMYFESNVPWEGPGLGLGKKVY